MSLPTSTLTVNGRAIEMPTKTGTIGPSVIDISKLYAQTGQFTYDPGFTSTASCESKITYIDGDEGVLLYRATRSSSWPSTATSSRPATCCCTASCRPRPRRPISITASRATRWCMTR